MCPRSTGHVQDGKSAQAARYGVNVDLNLFDLLTLECLLTDCLFRLKCIERRAVYSATNGLLTPPE